MSLKRLVQALRQIVELLCHGDESVIVLQAVVLVHLHVSLGKDRCI